MGANYLFGRLCSPGELLVYHGSKSGEFAHEREG